MPTIEELKQKQALPLDAKILATKNRIREWYEYWNGNVYVSFSGGKDSTVLLNIARDIYPDIKAVFVNTGLEYPEIVDFVKTFDNVTILRPKMTFKQVIEKYGYPFFGKEIAYTVQYARKYLTKLRDKCRDESKPIVGSPNIADIIGVDRRNEKDSPVYQKLKQGVLPTLKDMNDYCLDHKVKTPVRNQMLNGVLIHKEKGVPTNEYSRMYSRTRYKFMLDADFEVSERCCEVMKKSPVRLYEKENGGHGITAQLAEESRLRTQKWLKDGCNAFNTKKPVSNPMSFWTEQDVLKYIKINNLPIASVYGDIVFADDELEGQISIDNILGTDTRKLKTTGCERTGCVFCGFGSHLEKESRFVKLKETHPKLYDYIFRPTEEGGLGYKRIIDWINEHGDMNIRY